VGSRTGLTVVGRLPATTHQGVYVYEVVFALP
jgi:hypothetical protein